MDMSIAMLPKINVYVAACVVYRFHKIPNSMATIMGGVTAAINVP
jgi:hypothetical protein